MHAFRRIGVTVFTVSVLALAAVAPVSAATGKVESAHQRGPLINVSFSSIDASGCIDTETFVTANRTTDYRNDATGATTTIAAVNVFQFNLCTGETLLQLAGDTVSFGPDQFGVSNQLDSAFLRGTITVTNIDTGETSDMDVDVTVTGTSGINRDHSNTNDQYGAGCHVLNRWKGEGRDAAASGSVSQGGENFAPGTSISAEIGFVHDGFVVIGCA